MRDLWYKNAVIYCLDVETFMDGNGDGIGDFAGLRQRLDYLHGLGITCLWLLPFYPTPNRDNGYDVMDYYGVDPRHGTLGDFVEFIRQARERGIRVLIDLVVNHTSNLHPWFRSAREDPASPYRDYYVWRTDPPDESDDKVMFPGVQESIWSYDQVAKAWYLHRFYWHQPDLNISNPAVREEIERIMGFWLELGVSGFRVDAAPYLIELKGIQDERVADPYDYLREFREFLSWRRGDAILLAEADVPVDRIPHYFGEQGEKLQMLFDFYVNKHLFLALARQEAGPLADALREQPSIPEVAQWAHFIRNHDELDLERLARRELEEVLEAFAPDERARLYGRGIRRRLPPMLDGDRRRIELAYSLLFTLPGTPVLRYGEEIGMGDDLSLPERTAVRTPMQWSADRNAGFSTADPEHLARPVVDEGPFGYERVNVADQRRDPDSLLQWMQRLIRVRTESLEFGWGELQLLDTRDPAVLAHACRWEGGTVVAVHNFADEPRTVELDLGELDAEHAIHLLGDRELQPVHDGTYRMRLDRYGYCWLRLAGRRGAGRRPLPPPGVAMEQMADARARQERMRGEVDPSGAGGGNERDPAPAHGD